jgi:ubiquinone/menaquinone biosynthesis C-methylase UbiE
VEAAGNRRLFDAAATYYDLVTARVADWRASCGDLARHIDGDARTIVDLGTGPGVSAYELAHAVPRARVVGLDVSRAMLRRAVRNRSRHASAATRVELVAADAARLPLGGSSVDAVTTHSFLYLVTDRRSVLREIRRVLRPGGTVVCFEPRRDRPLFPSFRTWLQRPRYAWSMLLWGITGRIEGAFDEHELPRLLRDEGMDVWVAEPSLERYGWYVVAEAPRSLAATGEFL